jgi:hypothetical protein
MALEPVNSKKSNSRKSLETAKTPYPTIKIRRQFMKPPVSNNTFMEKAK